MVIPPVFYGFLWKKSLFDHWFIYICCSNFQDLASKTYQEIQSRGKYQTNEIWLVWLLKTSCDITMITCLRLCICVFCVNQKPRHESPNLSKLCIGSVPCKWWAITMDSEQVLQPLWFPNSHPVLRSLIFLFGHNFGGRGPLTIIISQGNYYSRSSLASN